MESIALAAPEIVPQITTTEYRIVEVHLFWDLPVISVKFRGTNGEMREWRVEGTAALAKLKALNTANLSVKSLHRRVMELAIADGVFAGSVAGTPDA